MSNLSEAVRRASMIAAFGLPLVLTACGGGGGGGGGDDPGTSAPKISSRSPDAGATGVALNRPVTVTFNKAIDCANTLSTKTFTLAAGSTTLDGTVACSGDQRSATFTPLAVMAAHTLHTATVTKAVTDTTGNHLATDASWSFTTGGTADTTAPTVINGTPTDGSAGVTVDSSLTVSFSEPMNCDSVKRAFTVKNASGAAVAGTVACGGDYQTATFDPTAALSAETQYTATVASTAKDLAGNALAAGYAWAFTTGAAPDKTPPTVTTTAPESGAPAVAPNANVVVNFNEAVDCSTVNATTFTLNTAAGAPVTARIACIGKSATLTPSAVLADGTEYVATVAAGVKDLAGNALGTNHSWHFTTSAAPDTTRPTVVALLPEDNVTGATTNTPVSVTFSEPMDCTTFTASSLFLKDNSNAPVAGTVSCSGSTGTFKPSTDLAGNTVYIAGVTNAVKDTAGNALATGRSWVFTTGAAPDKTPPTVASTDPKSSITDVAPDAAVSVTFSEAVDCDTATSATFTLKKVGGSALTGAITCSGKGVTFTPEAPLARGTEYVATLAAAIKDLAGNALGSAYSWHFTTRAKAWGTAKLLENAAGSVTDQQLAVNDKDAAVAVWLQSDAAGKNHLWLASYQQASGWGAPEAVESEVDSASQPKVIMDANGNSLVAWTQKYSDGSAVTTRVRAANGTWGTALRLWGDTPALALDGNGNALCIWRFTATTPLVRNEVFFTSYPLSSAPLNGSWTGAYVINKLDASTNDTRSISSAFSLAANKDGDATAAWTTYTPSSKAYAITAIRYSATDKSWGTVSNISSTSTTSLEGPTVVMNDAGDATAVWRKAVWMGGSSYYTYIQSNDYSRAGSAWGTEATVNWLNGTTFGNPVVAGTGKGDLFVAYSADYKAYFLRRPANGEWSAEAIVTGGNAALASGAAIDADGNAMVAWSEYYSRAINANHYNAAAATWDSAPTVVGPMGTNAGNPVLASDANGVVTAVWLTHAGDYVYNLTAARYE